MEDPVGGGLLRDDRSDSGVSSLRSAGSGDERSGSRSSALSATPPPTHRKIPEIWREGVMSQPPQGYPGGGTGPPAPLLIPPPSLYPALPPELWAAQKRHYPPHGLPPASTAGGGHLPPPPEELERAYHDSSRLIRERQREAEVRETKEREAAKERVEARERQERDRLEKQRAAEQAVHKHFEESLRLAQQKSRERNNCWINTLPGPPGSRAEEERKQQHHHQAAAAAAAAAAQHQVHAAAAAAAHHDRMLQERIRHDRERERAYFQQQQHQHQAAAAAQQQQQQQQQHQQQQQPQQVAQPPRVSLTTSTGGPKSSSQDYHPPPAHSRHKPVPEKPQQHTGLPKAEPLNFNFNFGYPRYQPSALSFLQQQQQAGKESGTLVVKQVIDRGVELMTNPSPHMTDLKNSVIVKNDKSPGLEKLHSGSPKLRTEYLPPAAKSPYEYRSPSQSPHPLSQHSPGPPHFEAQNLASISKVHVHRGQHLSPHPQRQSPHTPPHHRQSPHHRVSPHHPPSPHPMHSSPPGVVYTSKPATVGSYPYPTASVASSVHYAPPPTTPPKTGPKVSSPSPAQSYQPKVVGRPLSRSEAVPKPLTPSPYQQLSQHNLPPPHQIAGAATSGLPPPPAAHAHPPKVYSSPGLVGVPKSAGSPSSPTQTQPLDLGVGSIKEEPRSPKRKAMSPEIEATDLKKPKIEIKKEPVEDVGLGAAAAAVPPTLPMLARVSEASPLLATAATTITTVLNNSLPQGQDSSRPTTPSRPPSQEQQQQDKSAGSPRPPTAAPYPVHKLKKAWLQRHSGEDATDTSSGTIRGTGSCVTLPMPVTNPPSITAARKSPVESSGVVNSIHSIGSMAVNSIKKPKTPRKSGGAKELNGHFSSKNSTTTTPSGNGGTGGGGLAGGGGGGGAADGDDSSSSDPERTKSTQQKRVPPKVKRKKGGRKNEVKEDAKRKKTSVSSTESDKESGSEKESDTNSTGSKKKEEKGAKKRGRKPKTTPSKNGNEEESRKKVKDEERMTPQRDSIPQKPSIGHLKKTGESFLQDGPCFEVAPKLAKCRECRWTPNQRKCNMPNIFCRFYAFRRLRYTKNGQLAIAGFSDPHRDALQDDLKLWMPPSEECLPPGLDVEMSKFLLAQVGDQFCDLLLQEKEAIAVHMSDDKTIAWKRVVQGVREMCDVCETTLFNFHWACGKCGFVVCIDCYKGRKNGSIKIWGEQGRDRDDLSWLLCTNRQAHEQDRLMLTQIIAGDSLTQLGTKVHDVRNTLGQRCHCQDSTTACGGGAAAVSSDSNSNGGGEKRESLSPVPSQPPSSNNSTTSPPVSNGKIKSEGDSSDEDKDSNYSTLRELLIRPSGKSNGSRASSPVVGPIKKTTLDNLDQVISTVIEHSVAKDSEPSNNNQPGPKELKHFVRRYKRFGMFSGGASNDPALHVRIMTMTESKVLYPEVPHAWLCDGKLLRLIDATNERNYLAFQDQWKRGQPVLISDVTKSLDTSLWTPESFSEDFGDTKNDIVNCLTGNTVPNQPMRKFWDGFDCIGKRLKDERGSPMVLKLKDWPPGEDFAEMLPSRFADLMKVLPMGEYTHRTGRLNLASRLPDCFVRPDLGPKMYTAYGSASHSAAAGTTNLHLDISDAVNVMVYVGIPTDVDHDQCNKDVYRAIDEAGCDMLTRRRAREKGILPGALWHIYMARDADKIRDLLNKVELERGARLEPYHDPIHDQSWYLDVTLRERLYKEYGVEGYAIVQCQGDAVFIPAGAPHQVRNLHNCIKVAEDFVSPENVSHCFHLTQEFRELSDTHTNHEDKLQIKNIMYHAVKDSLAVLASVDPSSSAPGGAAATANSIAATTTTTGAACVDDAKKSTATSNGDGGGVPPSTNNSSNSVNNASSPLQSSVTKEEA